MALAARNLYMNDKSPVGPLLSDTHIAALYLIACALNRALPDSAFVASLDHGSLYKFAVSQNVDAMLGWVLSLTDCGEMNARWKAAYNHSVRKTMLFDSERSKVFSFLEENKIWHMPLKGILMKDLYPVYGMRQMADNDILFDSKYAAAVKDFFVGLGYECNCNDLSNHDVYHKQPFFNFEMHRFLFHRATPFYDYYREVESRLHKDTDKAYSFHFSKEDFYVYLYLHFAKHLHGSGTGIRSLADLYLYRTHHPNLDSSYISGELALFDLAQEEQFIQKLTRKLFSEPTPGFLSLLNPEEETFLLQFLTNGTYGTMKNRLSNALSRYDESSKFARKLRFIKDRLLPDFEEKLPYYPAFFSRHKWTKPLFYLYRIFSCLILNRKELWKEITSLIRL